MRQTQGVLWTKGVLLAPQHLQIQDRFLEDLMEFRLGTLAPWRWGFSELEVDREALAGGAVALSRASGIFPDGLLFDIPGADDAPPPRPLEEVWTDPERSVLELHLAIPERRAGAPNVATGSGGASVRYESEVVLRRDENTGGAEKPVQVARKNLRILADTENLEGLSTLRTVRVRRDETGEFQVDPAFVPPALRLEASPHLISLTRRLVELLSARSSTLAGGRRKRSQNLADFGVADVANFWLLYTVNTHLPLFRHHLDSGRTHPADLFESMLALAGALTTFADDADARELPLYDHRELERCFDDLDVRIRELLQTVVPTRHVSLPLRRTETSIHATALEEERYLRPTEAYLALRAGMEDGEMARRVPQLVKVGSGDRIETLIRQALGGVPLTHVPDPPGALPVKLDYLYFRLDRSGEEWEAIRRARNLAVYLPSDLPEAQGELVLLLPPESRGR
jgi:type VI secretion system protein ImpJ